VGIAEQRRRLDAIDAQILRLLASRLEIVARIGEEKRRLGVSTYDPMRDHEVIDRILREGRGRLPAVGLRSLYRQIIAASRGLETRKPVAFLGHPGGFTNQAARERFGDEIALEACESPARILAGLDAGDFEYCVVSLEPFPFEPHFDRIDLFLHSEARIFAEFYVVRRAGLFARPKARGVKNVFVCPGMMSVCSRWVAQASSQIRLIPTASVEDGIGRAIARRGAVLGYGALETAAGLVWKQGGLEDEPLLFRRFLVLAGADAAPSGEDKTSCLLLLADRPGRLHELTETLVRRRINLLWVEPRRTPVGAGEAVLLLEIEGHRSDPVVRDALEELSGTTEWFRILGSYPRERPPAGSSE